MAENPQNIHEAATGRPVPAGVKGLGAVGWLRWGWRQLTSMRTALILLFLLALASVPGGLLPQRAQAPEKVQAYLTQHKQLGPWLDRFSLFDVFSAPWFAAIYLLLFVSLAGCVIPRAWTHFQNMRSKPPAAPRNLLRLPQNGSYETDASPDEVLGTARKILGRRRFRIDNGKDSVAAEKGYLGEWGNLIFHVALLVLLFAVGFGSAYGYKGNVLVTERSGFSNSLNLYDSFKPGRAFSADSLQPFTLDLDRFTARYVTQGPEMGMADDFQAHIRYVDGAPGQAKEKPYDLKVNEPLSIGGAKVYLLGHGYSPTFQVTDGKGNVVFDDAVPFLPMEPRNLTSEGVIKVPDAQPKQLAFYANFFPTAKPDARGKAVSGFPAALNPMVSVVAFQGDLGLNNGTPQSVYKLEGMGRTLFPVKDSKGVVQQQLLPIGGTMTLPNGLGTIKFTGYRQWISLQITHDPGRVPALFAGYLAIAAIILSFFVRRRRVWVRASAGEAGRTVVHVGGLTLGNPTSEFEDILAALRSATTEAHPEQTPPSEADRSAAPQTSDSVNSVTAATEE